MENKKIADIIIKQIHLFFISGLYGILLGASVGCERKSEHSTRCD